MNDAPMQRPWGPLAPPVNPVETQERMRAQSLLTGSLIGGVCPPLTIDQARDVLRWNKETTA